MHTSLLKRPIAVTMCLIAIVVLGIISTLKLPVSLMPDIDVPQITVQVSTPGYSAKEVEQQYVGMLRGQLTQVDGVAQLRSESRADGGSVTLTFEPGSDMDLLFIEVNEKIDRAMNNMPKGSDRPKVIKAGATDIPAFYLDINLKDNSSDERFAELGRFARGVVSKRVEQLPQTAMVDMSGTIGTDIVITPDADKMLSMGLTHRDIEDAISRSNIQMEALSVTDGIFRYHVHFDAQLLTKDDVAGIYLKHEGRLLQLRDICRIEERMQEPTGIVRHDGKRAVTMAIIKQNDARMDDLQESMQTLLDDMRTEYPDVEFTLTRDQTELLAFTMDNLRQNLIVGALLASVILLVFMRQWRLSVLVVISIPLSLILTLLGFGATGVSMNIISLSGLILGVGMIVDNAIIVIDNIMRRWRDGDAIEVATVLGTREVFVPMLSSVLTTCSVFIPLVFLSGTAGALFFDQAVGITMSLFASLVVAAVVVPVYFFNLYRRGRSNRNDRSNRRSSQQPIRLYEKTLHHVLKHTKLYVIAAICCIPLIVLVAWMIEKQRMPELPHHDMLVRIDWNEPISATENDRRTADLLTSVKGMTKSQTTMCGTQDFMLAHTPNISQSEAVVYVDAASADSLTIVQQRLAEKMKVGYPKSTMEVTAAGNIFSLLFSTDEADLEIRLQDNDGRRPSLAQSRRVIDSLRVHFPDINIMPVETETDVRLVVDMERMALHRVSYDALLSRMKSLVNLGKVMEINDGAQAVPVIISSDRREADGLLGETVINDEGTPIPICLLVDSRQGEDYKRLEASASGAFYGIRIKATDKEVERIMAYTDMLVKSHSMELSATYDGGYFSSRKMIGELAIVLCVALALLFLILAAQFESMVQPLIILIEIVVDVFFVLLMLWMMGMSLNIMSMIGLVVVSGIVINDSILKVDTINRLRHGGAPLIIAIARAGHMRLRPIIMTSLTTILALVPFLFQNDMGSALQRPLSVTLIIGMTVGTLVSLFFIPLIYYIIYRKK